MESIEILCIGHIAYDAVMIVDAYPGENTKAVAGDRLLCGGGPAANAACLCGSWGTPTAWIGHVGNDVFGRELIADFGRFGVDTAWAVIRENHPTPFSSVVVNLTNGSRTIINHRDPQFVEENEVLFDGLQPKAILVDGHEPVAGMSAINMFPNAVSGLDGGSLNDDTYALAKRVDYAVVSEVFAIEAAGKGRPESDDERAGCTAAVASLLGTGTAVTFGEMGVWYTANGEEPFHVPALQVDAVDTTGAGDLFHGSFTWAAAKGYGFRECLEIAAAAAGLSVTRPGGRTSIPDRSEVFALWNEPPVNE